jgi:hypothetical protein
MASLERLAQARTHGWRATASRTLGGWHAVAFVRAQEARDAKEISQHCALHVQAAAWHKWQKALDAACPHMRLLRWAWARRRRATRRRVLSAWRAWAPVARAKRRRERDKLAAMARWRRRRWGLGPGARGNGLGAGFFHVAASCGTFRCHSVSKSEPHPCVGSSRTNPCNPSGCGVRCGSTRPAGGASRRSRLVRAPTSGEVGWAQGLWPSEGAADHPLLGGMHGV